MRRLGIRWRLTVWYGCVLSAILVGFSGTVYLLMRHHLIVLTHAALAEELADFAGDVGRCKDLADYPRELGVRYTSHEGYEFQVRDVRGVSHFRSDRLGPNGLPMPRITIPSPKLIYENLSLEPLGRARMASRVVPSPHGPMLIQAAISLAPNLRALRELSTMLLLAGPLALAGAIGGGYVMARTALAPVDRMAAAAAEITATRLDRRLDEPHAEDELGRLARTFNAMIARLQRSFEEVRRFTADAAHELRTPLAAMQTEAEVALRSPRSPERDAQVLEDLLEEIERLSRLVTQLLFLCREDTGVGGSEFRPVLLDDVVRDVGEHMQVAASEKGIGLDIHLSAPGLVGGDVDRLRQLFFNLLDNAIKYTPPGGRVAVQSESPNGQVRVTVNDTGVGIPAVDLPHVFERFYRVDPSRNPATDGTGLGLAICRAIVEAHGGRIEIESMPGSGTSIRVVLPLRVENMPNGLATGHFVAAGNDNDSE